MNFLPFRSDVSTLFKEMNIPYFTDLIKILNILFVYDSLNKHLPNAICSFFLKNLITHITVKYVIYFFSSSI